MTRPSRQTISHAEPKPHYIAAEYFALEAQSEVRHEFFEGEIFAMAGVSVAHDSIAQNFILKLRPALRGKKCRVQMAAVRLAVEEGRHYAYSDVMVSCDPLDRRASQQLRSPMLIVEVLPPSTEAHDQGLKFNQYKKLASLRHYLLVSQTTWLVEWYQLTGHGARAHTALAAAADTLAIPALGLTMTLAEVYEEAGLALMKLSFDAVEEPAPPFDRAQP